jgi:hypothetical protein
LCVWGGTVFWLRRAFIFHLQHSVTNLACFIFSWRLTLHDTVDKFSWVGVAVAPRAVLASNKIQLITQVSWELCWVANWVICIWQHHSPVPAPSPFGMPMVLELCWCC